MTCRLQDLAADIVRVQTELDREIETHRRTLGWHVRDRMVEFEHGIAAEHRVLRKSVAGFLARAPISSVTTSPVIYSLILPMFLVDGWVSAYQAICFRAYRISRVRRADYIVFDRRHLAYLNWIEVVNCLFCAYANGLFAYFREIGSRTEQYWCSIKHALRVYDPHRRYQAFLDYGDAEGYRSRLEDFRQKLRMETEDGRSPAEVA